MSAPRLAGPLVLGVLLAPLSGCRESTPELPEPPGAESYWVARTDTELDRELKGTCARAVSAGKPLLLNFSAPWCGDCRQVRRLEAQPALASELARWEKVVVDVGRLDRHPALLSHYKVSAIAKWVALKPDNCADPVTDWPVLKQGTLEPATGLLGPRTVGDLVAWLEDARGA